MKDSEGEGREESAAGRGQEPGGAEGGPSPCLWSSSRERRESLGLGQEKERRQTRTRRRGVVDLPPHRPPFLAMATASTSTLTSLEHHHTAPAQVISDLEAARTPASASDAVWGDATESSLLWLLSLGSTTKEDGNGKGKGKEEVVHWYCGRDGAEACWESAVFSIRLLSFKRQGEVGMWRDEFDR